MKRIKAKEPIIKPGDKVRMQYPKNKLDKGYYPNWTDQIYTVVKAIKGENVPMFYIKDYSGKLMKERVYANQIQKIKEKLHRVQRVIKERTRKGKKEYFVKWLNYPETYNSWIRATDLKKLK